MKYPISRISLQLRGQLKLDEDVDGFEPRDGCFEDLGGGFEVDLDVDTFVKTMPLPLLNLALSSLKARFSR